MTTEFKKKMSAIFFATLAFLWGVFGFVFVCGCAHWVFTQEDFLEAHQMASARGVEFKPGFQKIEQTSTVVVIR